MNIYFACSLTGGRQDERIYQNIVAYLHGAGHHVPTAFLAQANIRATEASTSSADIYQRDTAWIEDCDLLIAEVSTPSHGVGYEIGYALNLGKPVLCLHHRDALLSKMIAGNPDSRLFVQDYNTPDEAFALIEEFLTR